MLQRYPCFELQSISDILPWRFTPPQLALPSFPGDDCQVLKQYKINLNIYI